MINETHFWQLCFSVPGMQTNQTTEWLGKKSFDQMTSAAAAKKLLSTCAWILQIELFQSWFQAVYLTTTAS